MPVADLRSIFSLDENRAHRQTGGWEKLKHIKVHVKGVDKAIRLQ